MNDNEMIGAYREYVDQHKAELTRLYTQVVSGEISLRGVGSLLFYMIEDANRLCDAVDWPSMAE